MKIVMLDRTGMDFSFEKKIFRREGATFVVTYYKDAEDLKQITRDADVLMFNDAIITADIINCLLKCKMIIRYARDVDTVDLSAAGKRGIYVCNAPDYATTDIAEHTMALLLATAKQIPYADKCARSGQWNPERIGKARRLAGKTLGLIGFDASARLVAARAKAFDMEVMVADPFYEDDDAIGDIVKFVDMNTLLKHADFVSLHVPHTEETHHMMNMHVFEKMKKDAVLLNACHGGLINENELVFALLSSEIGGVGLDVFETEPLPLQHKLFTMERAVLTPHIAAVTPDGDAALHQEVTENVCRILRGDTPLHIVNQAYLKIVL